MDGSFIPVKTHDDLLKISLKLSNLENKDYSSSVRTLSDKDKKFLDDALDSCFVNQTKEMIKLLDTLEKSPLVNKINESLNDYQKEIFILEQLFDYCEDIDLSKDFYKIGGIALLKKLLNCQINDIIYRVCYLISCCSKNHIFMQKIFFEEGFIDELLKLFFAENSSFNVNLQIINALSSIVNNFNDALKYLFSTNHSKIHQLINFSLNSKNDLARKCLFFIRNIANTSAEIFDHNFVIEDSQDSFFNLPAYFFEEFRNIKMDNPLNRKMMDDLVNVLSSFIQISPNFGLILKENTDFVNRILLILDELHKIENLDEDIDFFLKYFKKDVFALI